MTCQMTFWSFDIGMYSYKGRLHFALDSGYEWSIETSHEPLWFFDSRISCYKGRVTFHSRQWITGFSWSKRLLEYGGSN